ncbi:MAG: GNAT family N-acetyltransferase [Anaeromyxobacteraceae bacterium]
MGSVRDRPVADAQTRRDAAVANWPTPTLRAIFWSVEVVTLSPCDMEACLDLFEAVVDERVWLATEPPVDRREVRARWRALLATQTGTILVAREGGRPIGLSAMVGVERPELGMLVAEEARGRGVGAALLRASVAWADEAGAREIVLHVFPANTRAVRLYRRFGFVERERLLRAYPRANGERWDALRMTRPVHAVMARAV